MKPWRSSTGPGTYAPRTAPTGRDACTRNASVIREASATTYTAAAVLLANHALYGYGASSGLFRGETLPAVVDPAGLAERLGES